MGWAHDVLNRFSGARVGADQKTQFVDGLLDAALEQLVSFPVLLSKGVPRR